MARRVAARRGGVSCRPGGLRRGRAGWWCPTSAARSVDPLAEPDLVADADQLTGTADREDGRADVLALVQLREELPQQHVHVPLKAVVVDARALDADRPLAHGCLRMCGTPRIARFPGGVDPGGLFP